MASLARDKDGTKRIQFTDTGRKRRTIRLGKVPVKVAVSFKANTEKLIACRRLGTAIDPQTTQWLAELSDELHERLERVGLVEAREPDECPTVAELIEHFIANATVKPSTLAAYRQTTNSLIEFLGADTPIDDVCTMDADNWRRSLADDPGLSPATETKRSIVAKAIFARAVRWGWLDESPFAHLRGGSQSNPKRSAYITPETVQRVIDACPSAQWRAIVGVARFAGLRCPSELAELTWADVSWEHARLTVRSPKTEGTEGHAVRVVPIDPRIMPLLQELFDEAEPGSERVFEGITAQTNLRTQMLRIMAHAGVAAWPRLFHALRASCSCDWVERFPDHVVASWLGHSPRVAAEHYLQTRDEHFRMAAGMDSQAGQGGAYSGARLAQNAAQHTTADERTEAPIESQVSSSCEVVRSAAVECCQSQSMKVGGEGFEPPKAFADRFTVCSNCPLWHPPIVALTVWVRVEM